MSESQDLLGDSPVSVDSYVPKESSSAAKLIQDLEDSEAISLQPKQISFVAASSQSGTPNYDKLKQMLDTGSDLYVVKNLSKILLYIPWDLVLMPTDLVPDFKRYLSAKYTQYNMAHLAKSDTLMVAIFQNGRTVNFLENFMVEKNVPIIMAVQEGMETALRSRFVIPPDDSVICTAEQLKSLEQFHATQYVASEDKKSSTLGFLRFTQVTTEKELRKVKRSYVTLADTIQGRIDVAPIDMKVKSSRVQGNFVAV